MTPSANRPLFSISNHHAQADGDQPPPAIDGDERNTYHSYFENMHGDQSIFLFRHDTGEAVVYSGDAGWTAFPIVAGEVQGLVLSHDEKLWLRACLLASGIGRS